MATIKFPHVLAMVRFSKETEREGRIEWLTDLKHTLLHGRLEDAVDNIDAAIKLLERENGTTTI